MSYEVRLLPGAQRQLDGFSGKDLQQIVALISGLASEPRTSDVKKLAGSGFWRARSGDFRAVYEIDDEKKVVRIFRVARRSEDTYKGL